MRTFSRIILAICFIFALPLFSGEEVRHSLWMPFTGVQVNSSSLPLSKTANQNTSEATPLDISGSTIYWPTVQMVDFTGYSYLKFDYSGFGAAFLNLMGLSNFSFTEKRVNQQAEASLESSRDNRLNVVLIEAVGFVPHLELGLFAGENVLHGLGLNLNQISIGYIHASSPNFAPEKNLAQEIGIQYQTVFPIAEGIHANPSATVNMLGKDWFQEARGNSFILDCSFVFKVMDQISIYWNVGYARRNIEIENPLAGNSNREHLSINSFTMRLATAFHNVFFFGNQFGAN